MLNINEKTEPVASLDNKVFGIVIHNVFKNLFDRKISVTDNTYLDKFQSEFIKQMKDYDAYLYNNVEQFIA